MADRRKGQLALEDNGIRNPWPADGLLKPWLRVALLFLRLRCREERLHCESRDVYEFGVYSGRALRGMALQANRTERPLSFRLLWGFDSFVGLPADASSVSGDSRWAWLQREAYRPGRYSLSRVVGNAEGAQVSVRAYVNDSRVHLIVSRRPCRSLAHPIPTQSTIPARGSRAGSTRRSRPSSPWSGAIYRGAHRG